MIKVTQNVWFYVVGQVSKGWSDAILIYAILSYIADPTYNVAYLLVPFLTVPPFIYLCVSPWFSKWADKQSPTVLMKTSIALKLVYLSIIIVCIYLIFAKNLFGYAILSVVIFAGLIADLDSSLHGPVPFILAKSSGISLVRFRVIQILLLRGANTFTPIIGVLLYKNFVFLILLFVSMNLVAVMSSLFLKHVSKENTATSNNTNPSSEQSNMIVAIAYGILIFCLNATFANTAAVLLLSQLQNQQDIPLYNSIYFLGFVVGSLLLVLRPYYIESVSKSIATNLLSISVTLLLIGLSYIYINKFSLNISLLLLLFSGVMYSINLHLVTTQLPSFFKLQSIYSNINLGLIFGGLGGVISGIWVGRLASSKGDALNLLSVMGTLSVLLALLIIALLLIASPLFRKLKLG